MEEIFQSRSNIEIFASDIKIYTIDQYCVTTVNKEYTLGFRDS